MVAAIPFRVEWWTAMLHKKIPHFISAIERVQPVLRAIE
jgi:hypothetical protein